MSTKGRQIPVPSELQAILAERNWKSVESCMLRVGRCQIVLCSDKQDRVVKVLELNSSANLVSLLSYDLRSHTEKKIKVLQN